MKLHTLLSWSALSFAAVVAPAFGQQRGLQGQMDQMFGQMSTSAPPQVVNDARRGVISGGSLEIRAPVAPQGTTALNFTPPEVTAGCGGISLYGGSLSYISGQQIVQEFKTIASNAEGLAFQMALQAMSDQLSHQISWFSNVQKDLSTHLQSSCELASSALQKSGAAGAISSFGTQVGQKVATATGDVSDAAAASEANTPGNSISNAEAAKHPDVMNKLVYGNMVWMALSNHNMGQLFGGGNVLQEEIMSLTGTVIVCNPKSDRNCPSSGGDDGIGLTYVRPTLKLEDVMYGSANGNDQILSCGGDTQRCMNPTTSTWTNQGFLTMVSQELGADGSSGIVGALMSGSSLTPEQVNFMANTGGAGALLVNLGRANPGAMSGFSRQIAAPLALEMARKLVYQMIDAASASLAGMQNPAAAEYQAQISARRAEIDREYNALRQDHQFDTDAFNLYKVYVSTAPTNSHADPAISPGLR
ncbi:conjugal transfer protein TraH [Rhodanobacter sp. FW106-PBR-R2A-1-13]|uniref:conjugal transfer protein TraH n=1 Tax=Rhodanobacter sp. FW106-PBR-R2A-1-13 TaxID=3454845 RepID=UPI0034E41D3E